MLFAERTEGASRVSKIRAFLATHLRLHTKLKMCRRITKAVMLTDLQMSSSPLNIITITLPMGYSVLL